MSKKSEDWMDDWLGDWDTLDPFSLPPENKEKECECGAEKCGYNVHANYCPKYVKDEK